MYDIYTYIYIYNRFSNTYNIYKVDNIKKNGKIHRVIYNSTISLPSNTLRPNQYESTK